MALAMIGEMAAGIDERFNSANPDAYCSKPAMTTVIGPATYTQKIRHVNVCDLDNKDRNHSPNTKYTLPKKPKMHVYAINVP